jgi:hypothetical protein
MKKITFIILVFLPSLLFAQHNLSIGIKGGVINSFAPKNYSNRLGICIGGFANIKLTERLSFQPEILYSSKGYKINEVEIHTAQGQLVGDVDFIYKFNYIEVPLLLKASCGKTHKPYLLAGAVPSFLISASFKDATGSHDIKATNKVDLGLLIGAGIDFKLSERTYIFIEPRFNYGVVSYIGNFNNKSIYLLSGLRF